MCRQFDGLYIKTQRPYYESLAGLMLMLRKQHWKSTENISFNVVPLITLRLMEIIHIFITKHSVYLTSTYISLNLCNTSFALLGVRTICCISSLSRSLSSQYQTSNPLSSQHATSREKWAFCCSSSLSAESLTVLLFAGTLTAVKNLSRVKFSLV